MKRRTVLRSSGLAAVQLGLLQKSRAARKNDKPNLLFIMTDQQRFDALGYAGNKILKTPHMDRLAKEGVWFENAHTQCAVCGPARASMLTGCAVANTKVITNKEAYKKEESGIMPMKTYDEILSGNGYACEYYGKWHTPTYRGRVYNNPVTMAGIHESELGPGEKEAYVRYLAPRFPERAPKENEFMDTLTERPYAPDPLDRRFALKQKGEAYDVKVGQSDIHGTVSIPSKYYIAAFEAGKTLKALDKLKDRPFSLTCSFHHPHPPYLAAAEYAEMYLPEKMELPESLGDDMKNSPYRSSRRADYTDPDGVRHFISKYYALVKEIDDWVGLLLNKLDELGLSDNTMVVFTSDHGEMLGSHGMRGKFCFYEESSHVPMLIRFPGRIQAGTKVKAAVGNVSLFPTILDYMGLPEHPSDSDSLRGLIEGKVPEKEAYVVTEWLPQLNHKPAHMILKDGWKYMRPHESGTKVKAGLYNLNKDPHEMNNLIADNAGLKKYAGKRAELESCFQAWMKRTKQAG